MPASIPVLTGNARSTRAIALRVMFTFGVSLICAIQAAHAMSEVKKMEVGEILVESTAGSLHCEIVTQSVSQNLEMRAVVWSSEVATGTYSFVVTKLGVSARSNVAQSGLFDVEPLEKRIVGSVMVNTSRGDRYFARLSAHSGDDEVICDTIIE